MADKEPKSTVGKIGNIPWNKGLTKEFLDKLKSINDLNDSINNLIVNVIGVKTSIEEQSVKEEIKSLNADISAIKDLIEKHFSSKGETKESEPKKRGRKKKEEKTEASTEVALVKATKQNKDEQKELFKFVINEIVKSFSTHIQSIQNAPAVVDDPRLQIAGPQPKLLGGPVYDAEFVSEGTSKAQRVRDENIIDAEYEDVTPKKRTPRQRKAKAEKVEGKKAEKVEKPSSDVLDQILATLIIISSDVSNLYKLLKNKFTDDERKRRESDVEKDRPIKEQADKKQFKKPGGLLGIIYAAAAALTAAIWDTVSAAIKVIKGVGSRILKFFPKVKTFFTSIITKISNFVQPLLNLFKSGGKLSGLGSSLGKIFGSIGKAVGNFLRYGRTVLRGIGKFSGILTIVMSIFDFFRGFLNADKLIGKGSASFMEKILAGLTTALTELIYGTFKSIVELFDMIFGTTFSKGLADVDEVVSIVLDSIIDFKDALVNVFKKGSLMITDVIYSVMEFIGSIVSKIPGLGDFGKSLQEKGQSGKAENQKTREAIDKQSAETANEKSAGRAKRDKERAAAKASQAESTSTPTSSGVAQEDKQAPSQNATPTGSAKSSGGQTPQRTGSNDVLGVQNNNPGNIRATNTKWEGMVGENKGFVVFKDMAYGVRAIGKIMASYMKRGINTIRKAISTYAPPNENNTEQYIKFVSQQTGLDPDQPINLTEPKVLKPLIKAITQMEVGRNNAPDDSIIAKGISLVDKENIQAESPSGSESTSSAVTSSSTPSSSGGSSQSPQMISANPQVGEQTASLSAQNSGAVTASEVATPYAALASGSGGSTVVNNNNVSSSSGSGSGGSESTRNSENTFQKLQLLQAYNLV